MTNKKLKRLLRIFAVMGSRHLYKPDKRSVQLFFDGDPFMASGEYTDEVY